ncbi:MAG: RagB/SusD family nutrient uptake outer membrane protein [Cyclobacteriaceae bacterium]
MKILRYLTVLILLFSFGCSEDFLEREPVDKLVIENFYETPEQANQGLMAIYSNLYDGDSDFLPLIAEVASDNCFAGGGKTDPDDYLRYDRFLPNPLDNVNQGNWEAYYAGIFRSNVLISNMANINWESEEKEKIKIEAEARFLRAYNYFNLTRMFGEVPLVTTVLKPGDEATSASVEDIYALIVADLMFAADNLLAEDNSSASDFGRVTKWAAEAMLGRVFLYYTGYYGKEDVAGKLTLEQTRNYIDDVIDNSGHDLVDNFAGLWIVPAESQGVDYAGEGNKEVVFAYKYTFNQAGYGTAYWQRLIGPRNYAVPPYGQGWGFATVNPKLWFAYSPDDTRRNATILSWEAEGIDPAYDPSDQRQYTGYNWKKYMQLSETEGQNYTIDLGAPDWQYWAYEDFISIRFSDVLLMGSELHLNGDLARANELINRVRNRAFQNEDNQVTLTGPNQQSKDIIMEERRLELALEGQRYWDLLRQTGNSDFTVIKNAVNNEDPDHASDDLESFDVTFREETRGLFQIPPVEIRLMNGSIEQNEGYN